MDKIIFLDVDGVLNSSETKEEYEPYIPGLDAENLAVLRRIVERTGAVLVLTSTWKFGWERENKAAQSDSGHYLDRRLNDFGLRISDKTADDGVCRGKGIREWLRKNRSSDSGTKWIVLDDQEFPDFAEEGILPHFIKTDYFDGGLGRRHVGKALRLLGEGILERLFRFCGK